MIDNKDKYIDNVEVYSLLEAFEHAVKDQKRDLTIGIILKKLELKGIKIAVLKEDQQSLLVQSNENHHPRKEV